MKKIFILCLSMIIFITGCGEVSKESLVEKYEKSINDLESYKLTGKMEIINGEEKFVYNLESNFLKDDYYKVILINETNNHEQIILRNEEGVYVISPNLNKSFKFDSIWPENSSQAYLLESLLNDIKNDENSELIESEEEYIIKSTVNYPNNSTFKYQKIYFDKDMIPTKVEVYDNNDKAAITVNITSVDYKANLKSEDFILEDYIDKTDCEESCEEDQNCIDTCSSSQTTSSLSDIIYPMYLPENTTLTSSEEINADNSERIILTFSGDKNFVLIEEVSKISEEHEIIPITGNPLLLNDTIGALSTNSMYFTRNNVDYYLVSNDLTNEEMVNVALSLGNDVSVLSTK